MQTRDLPDDIDTFKRLILASDARVSHLEQQLAASEQDGQLLTLLIEKLKLQIARFKRTQFSSSSERYEGQLLQLELLVKDLEATQAQNENITSTGCHHDGSWQPHRHSGTPQSADSFAQADDRAYAVVYLQHLWQQYDQDR